MCRRDRKALAHALRLCGRCQPKKPFELAVELRGTRIAHGMTCRLCRYALAHHEQTGLMQARGFHVLHGRRTRDGLEMAMERGHAHAGLASQLRKIERLRVCGV